MRVKVGHQAFQEFLRANRLLLQFSNLEILEFPPLESLEDDESLQLVEAVDLGEPKRKENVVNLLPVMLRRI